MGGRARAYHGRRGRLVVAEARGRCAVLQGVTHPALLERAGELALLGRAWRRAVGGHGSAWLICAEAGGGKTRLLREATRGLPLRRGAAEPVVPPDPYLAVMQAVRGFRPAPHRADS